MKKIITRVSACCLSFALIFSGNGSAFAADQTTANKSETKSVIDIVPSEYITATKGKYDSVEDILDATGFKQAKTGNADNMQFDNGAITVNSLDEYAAVLSYYSDLENVINPTPLPVSPRSSYALENRAMATDFSVASTGSYTHVAEKTIWGDGLAAGANLSWITGVVKMTKDSATGNILEITETDSTLNDFHPGNSWRHSTTKTTHGIYSDKKSGWANIVGDRTLSIIFEGIGQIHTKEESYSMTF